MKAGIPAAVVPGESPRVGVAAPYAPGVIDAHALAIPGCPAFQACTATPGGPGVGGSTMGGAPRGGVIVPDVAAIARAGRERMEASSQVNLGRSTLLRYHEKTLTHTDVTCTFANLSRMPAVKLPHPYPHIERQVTMIKLQRGNHMSEQVVQEHSRACHTRDRTTISVTTSLPLLGRQVRGQVAHRDVNSRYVASECRGVDA